MITLERKIEILTNLNQNQSISISLTDDELDWYYSIFHMVDVDTLNTLIQLLREQKLNEILK